MSIATEINGRLYAIASDHLNTPRRLTNQQGQVAWQWLISGYGEVAPTIGNWGYVHSNSNRNYSEAATFELRYPGQQWDEETGLAYNLHRYYDALTGRYVQADPIGLEGGWNRFGYVDGNPLSFTDPKGLNPLQNLYLQFLLFNQRYGPTATALAADLAGVNGTLSTTWPGLSALPRALTAADLGLEGALAACKGSISFDGKTILMNVDYIEGTIPMGAMF